MSVGPAGENLVRSACIVVDGARVAGRCGLGAIFGSKNLKAIVVRGAMEIQVHNLEKLQITITETLEKLKNNEFNKNRMKYGVYCYEPWDIESPYRNFSGKIPSIDNKKRLSRDIFLKYKVGSKSCSACNIQCWSIYEFEENGKKICVEALQGNDIHNFGAKLDIPDAKSILKLHGICNDLSLDVDNVSGVIAWAMECYEKGILAKEDTDGLDLSWGNLEVVVELLYKIAYRKGFGNLLAEGCKIASKKLKRGSEKYCIHIKGQELFECMWVSPTWALGTAVSPRGGTHTRGVVIEEGLKGASPELYKKYFGISEMGDVTSYENKERLVIFFERLEAFLDSKGICLFTNSLRWIRCCPRIMLNYFLLLDGLLMKKNYFV